MKYKIKHDEYLHRGFFKIKASDLEVETFNAKESLNIRRFAIEKGPAVGVLVYLIDTNQFVLVRQFRYPITLIPSQDPWILEIAAGVIDAGFTSEEAAIKEVKEETGFIVQNIRLIQSVYPSPGILSEKIDLYFAECHSHKTGPIGDPDDPEEDIRVEYFTKEELQEKLNSGKITDAKTAIAIYSAISGPLP